MKEESHSSSSSRSTTHPETGVAANTLFCFRNSRRFASRFLSLSSCTDERVGAGERKFGRAQVHASTRLSQQVALVQRHNIHSFIPQGSNSGLRDKIGPKVCFFTHKAMQNPSHSGFYAPPILQIPECCAGYSLRRIIMVIYFEMDDEPVETVEMWIRFI